MSATVRRRRRTVEERIGAQLRHGKPGDLQGRGEPLKRDRGAIVSRVGGVAGGDSEQVIEHLTAYPTAGQAIADGGGKILFDREAPRPTERRGFRTFSARLAADGEVDDIPIDATGYAYLYWRRRFADFKQSGTLEVVINRGGREIVHEVPMGAPATRAFDEPLGRFWVREDDTLGIREPNSSGERQSLLDDPDEVGVLDITIWAHAGATSDVPQPGSLDLVGFEEGEASTDAIAGTSVGDLLIAVVVSHNNANGGTVSTPAGWTFVERISNPGGPSIDTQPIDVFYRVATASEPSTYGTWTNDGLGAGDQWVGIANVGPGDPSTLDVQGEGSNAGGALTVPALGGALWLYILNKKADVLPEDRVLDDATLLGGPSGGSQVKGLWWEGHSGSERTKSFSTTEVTFAGIGVGA